MAKVEKGTAIALDPAGRKLALVRSGLSVLDLASEAQVQLHPAAPLCLAWSPDGARLAAAFEGAEGRSTLRLFGAGGEALAQAVSPGRVTSLLWRSGEELLGAAASLQVYSFGASRTEFLVRWDGKGEPTAVKLGDSTLKPSTLRHFGAALSDGPPLALSPLGDEVVHGRLHDPPMFAPYQAIVLRHLTSGASREVGRSWVGSQVIYSADGTRLLFGNGTRVAWRDPWAEKDVRSYASPGATLARSPQGRWTWVDGVLYEGERELASFPKATAEGFGPAGLLLRHQEALYLLEQLAEPAAPPVMASERLLELRKLRLEGLISAEDFQKAQAGGGAK